MARKPREGRRTSGSRARGAAAGRLAECVHHPLQAVDEAALNARLRILQREQDDSILPDQSLALLARGPFSESYPDSLEGRLGNVGAAALVDARLGRGRVILCGFRLVYRGQSMATHPLIWAAIRDRRGT